jgi:hypothetical protein
MRDEGSGLARIEALQDLETRLNRRFLGRVRDLRLVLRDTGLVLRGRTATYYAKQLAQQAVMEATDLPILANAIEVA